MTVNRRNMLAAGLGLSATAAALTAKSAAAQAVAAHDTVARPTIFDFAPGLQINAPQDQSALLQAAIDRAADKEIPLILPPGTIRAADLRLRSGTRLIGASGATVLEFSGGPAFITADKADGLLIEGIVFNGAFKAFDDMRGAGLLSLSRSKDVVLQDIEIKASAHIGLSLVEVAGRVSGVLIRDVLDAAIKSLDAKGLEITSSRIESAGNNGILVWRSEHGEDGTIVSGNRITKIRNASGGTGEFGNGINVFRAGSVIVSNNRIADCAYSAIRGNAASNIQIIANSCERLGEVAIYSEFGFQGAVIANNIVDGAATGVSVTNFNEGGRLAVIQGNLIRNLFRREHEVEDKRGEGIGVEADAVVTGNTIEGAPTVGIQVGWGTYLRDVAVTGNVIRQSAVGISISSAPGTGACLLANNLIASTPDGAIRAMTRGVVFGPDLAREPDKAERVTLSGNVAV